jgi:hypothetical protein
MEDLKRRLRDKLPQGAVRCENVAGAEALEDLCSLRARRSLCHCLVMSRTPRDLQPEETVVTQLQIDGSSPTLGDADEVSAIAEGEDPFDTWCLTLQDILRRWI